MKKLFILSIFLICSIAQASEVIGTINTGGSNAVGNVNTGGSQSTSTASTTVSGTVVVYPISNFKSGVYVQPISISLSAQNSDSIHYTLDTTNPTCSSGNTFSNSISINSTTTLKSVSCYGIKSFFVITWQYDFRVPRNNQSAPTNGNLTLQGSSNQALITNQNDSVNLTVPSGVATPTLDVSSFIRNGSGTLPEVIINSNNANGSIIKIPSGATVTSTSTSWDGVISAPIPRNITLPNPSGFTRSFSQAIQLGLTGSKLSFSKSVRILLSGQASKKAGWTRDDTTYTEITTICSADSQTLVDAQLGTDGDCKIDAGSDLVVWTKHFTTFVTYTETAVSTGGGGGGGGSSSGGGGGGGYVYIPTTSTTSTTTVVTTTSVNTSNNSQVVVNKYVFTKNLSLGSTGTEVLELQKLLVSLNFLKATPNGNYGPATKQSVINFQTSNKISPVGTVGPQTRISLNSQTQTNTILTNQTATTSQISTIKLVFTKNLGLDTSGDEVLNLQKLLVSLGLLKATPNGYFGPQTRLAVISYQKQNNITQTGTIGPLTRAVLNK
jgi:peptidoglycan hydrolase-like protein with peptidoglycan-binding domain